MNVVQFNLIGGNDERMFAVEGDTGRIYTTGWIRYSDYPVSYLSVCLILTNPGLDLHWGAADLD